MQIYSQTDPKYSGLTLGPTGPTIGKDGCLFMSLCTLYQVDPVQMLKNSGLFDAQGNLYSDYFAKACGGEYLGIVDQSQLAQLAADWCIAMTNYYETSFHTEHFFCFNHRTGEGIDPLKFPAGVEQLIGTRYPIVQVRGFSNVKFVAPPMPPFPDIPANDPNLTEIQWCKDKGIIKGFPDGLFHADIPVDRRQLAIVLYRALNG